MTVPIASYFDSTFCIELEPRIPRYLRKVFSRIHTFNEHHVDHQLHVLVVGKNKTSRIFE